MDPSGPPESANAEAVTRAVSAGARTRRTASLVTPMRLPFFISLVTNEYFDSGTRWCLRERSNWLSLLIGSSTAGRILCPTNGSFRASILRRRKSGTGRERQIAERSRSFCHRSRWAVQRSPGDAATPSRPIGDQATQRRYRQHFLGRDPLRTSASTDYLLKSGHRPKAHLSSRKCLLSPYDFVFSDALSRPQARSTASLTYSKPASLHRRGTQTHEKQRSTQERSMNNRGASGHKSMRPGPHPCSCP